MKIATVSKLQVRSQALSHRETVISPSNGSAEDCTKASNKLVYNLRSKTLGAIYNQVMIYLSGQICGHRKLISYRLDSMLFFMTALILVASVYPNSVLAKKCLYISSYHSGYAWSDGVERGLRSVLDGKCEIRKFNMDAKRNRQEEYLINKGLEAKHLIENWNPDIVITTDDIAAKYVIQAHFRDHEIPFVFCGVNWSADEYGFPYSNVTGMIEVAPIYPLLEKVQALYPNIKKAIYIGADTLTEKKNLARFDTALQKKEIHLDSSLVGTVNEWLSAYSKARKYDFIIIGSKSGIKKWDQEKVVSAISKLSQKLSVTNHSWMMPYTMLGFTKVPEEQGEWAAQAALNVLDGIEISQIAIVPNRRWDIWTNLSLLELSNINLPEGLIQKSKQVE
jgi:ABC-type uncharacterized transport system substrate-binding protein